MRIIKCRYNKRSKFEAIPGFVYCGRYFGGFNCSPLSNPFMEGRDGSRAEVIAQFRVWIWRMLQENYAPVIQALNQLNEQSVLGCWCVDKLEAGSGDLDCHCDVIARAWQWLRRNSK